MTRIKRVAVISLGGTIACAPAADGTGLVPMQDPAALVRLPGVEVETIPWSMTDSTEITFDELERLARHAARLERSGVDGIVVTQGTDTLDEAAWTLSLFRATRQPVVVTGAMRSPWAPGSDAAANLDAAVATSVLPELEVSTRGAAVVMNNQIHSAKWVQKNHTQRPDAFDSGEIGVLGVITEGTPRLLRKDIPDEVPCLMGAVPSMSTTVPLLPVSLDLDTSVLEAAADIGASGLVVEGVGGGHVSSDAATVLAHLAKRMPVVFAARPRSGAVLTRTYGSPGAELDLRAKGCLPAGFLSGPKARILLSLLLRRGLAREDVEKVFQKVAMTEPEDDVSLARGVPLAT